MAKRRRRAYGATKWRGNRVIAYIRVSDTTGRENTLISDHVQLNEIVRLCHQKGLTIVGEPIVELDKTGRSSKDRAIRSIIERVAKNEADGVVVWKISRWGRNLVDSMLNILELQDAGGFIASASEPLGDIDTPAGTFNLHVMLAIAQMYSDEIGKTWANIHTYRRGQGKTHNGTPRLGYLALKQLPEEDRGNFDVVEGCDYVVDPVKGPWVTKAYEWYVSGMSLHTVTEHLDQAGIRSTRGKRITYGSLLATLDGGFAAGYIVDRREHEPVFLPGKQTPLITQDTWEAYLKRRKTKVAPRTKSAPYRLAGLLRCAGCGGGMGVTYSTSGKALADGTKAKRPAYRYFRCNKLAKSAHTTSCPAPATMGEALAEQTLLDWLKGNNTGEQAVRTRIDRANAVDRAEVDKGKIQKEIARVEKRLSMLYDDKLDGVISTEVYKLKETELLAEQERLQAGLEATDVTLKVNALPQQTVFDALLYGWDSMPAEIFNTSLREVVSYVEITKAPTRSIGASARIVPTWEKVRKATTQVV